jgi:CRP/FNR family transcriptional regulator, cyclic AMP receptor protein
MTRGIPAAVIESFGRIPLFSGLSRRALRSVASAATELEVRAGTVIVTEGRSDRFLYVLVAGSADVTKGGRKRDTIEPGEFFGELAFLDAGPRSATVTATSDCKLLILSPREMNALIHVEPSLALGMIEVLARHLRAAGRSATE